MDTGVTEISLEARQRVELVHKQLLDEQLKNGNISFIYGYRWHLKVEKQKHGHARKTKAK